MHRLAQVYFQQKCPIPRTAVQLSSQQQPRSPGIPTGTPTREETASQGLTSYSIRQPAAAILQQRRGAGQTGAAPTDSEPSPSGLVQLFEIFYKPISRLCASPFTEVKSSQTVTIETCLNRKTAVLAEGNTKRTSPDCSDNNLWARRLTHASFDSTAKQQRKRKFI